VIIKIFSIFFFATFINSFCFTQSVAYQAIINGGVKITGISTGISPGIELVDLGIPASSEIKKIQLFSYGVNIDSISYLKVNNVIVDFSSTDIFLTTEHSSSFFSPIVFYQKDITSFLIDSDLSIVEVEILPCSSSLNCGNWTAFFMVEFESALASTTSFSIFIPDKNLYGNENYILSEFNPIDLQHPVAFSVFLDRACDITNDGTLVYFNGFYLGTIGGNDNNSNYICSGSQGCFQYFNQSIQNLCDDNDNLIMNETDALSDVASIISVLDSEFAVQLTHQIPNGTPGSRNINCLLNLAFSTPCDTFSVSVPNDTTICTGEVLQLSASGGQAYEWSSSVPAELNDLSCTNCPNPIFSGETSRFYTVRIWNNDSCSVVRPVKIIVRPRPLFGAITTSPSVCGASTGSVSVSAAVGTVGSVSFTLNSTLTQSSGVFSNLAAGTYSFSFTDGNGCVSRDTLITVAEVNNTIAQFTVSPAYGTVPLEVNLSNTSQNATDFLWAVNGTSMGAMLETYTCDPSGVYTFELIAWQYDPSCADTFLISVTAVDLLIVPTAFTPDGDGVNDFWELPNIDVIYPDNSVVIFNRWGSVVYESQKGKYALNPWKGDYNGEPLPVGSYFFIIKVDEEEEHDLKGSVTVVK